MIDLRGPWLFNNGQNSGYLDFPYLVLERDEKHYFRKYRGFAISRDVFEYAIDRNFQYYEVHYVPVMRAYIFNLPDFRTGYKVMFSGEIQYILPTDRAFKEFQVERFSPRHIPEYREVSP